MRTRDAVRYAKKIARQDIETIGANRAELMLGAKYLPGVRGDIENHLPLDDPRSFRIHPWAPRPGASLLNTAFREMREQTAKPAASKLKFANDVLVPLSGISPEDATHEGTWSRSNSAACGMAEYHFLSALRQTRELQGNHDRISTYIDDSGNPVLFRKSNFESTAISLRAIALGEDVVIPAGTILGLGNNMNRQQTGEYNGSWFTLATFAVPQVLQITPIRVSPWAYDNPADRAVFGLPRGRVSALREDCRRTPEEFIEQTTLDDYVDASQRIVELCAKPNA